MRGGGQILHAQNEVIKNLCFDEEFTERLAVTSDVDLKTLNIVDKLKFKTKAYKKKHHNYISELGKITKDVHFISHENMYPKWYVPASTIRADETGTKSYYTEDNKYLKDGWSGGSKTKTNRGEYIKNAKTGERYFHQPHSKSSEELYVNLNDFVDANGFLPSYLFTKPDSYHFSKIKNENYEIIEDDNIIKIADKTNNFVWDLNDKIIVKQKIEDDQLIKTTKHYYKYNETLKEDLLYKTITIEPGTFSKGGYFEIVKTNIYNNYSTSCFAKKIANTASVIKHLELLPNPASHIINVKIPDSDISANVKISNITGATLIERNIEGGKQEYAFNVNDFPAGIYIVKLTQNSTQYSSKFAKQ